MTDYAIPTERVLGADVLADERCVTVHPWATIYNPADPIVHDLARAVGVEA